MPTSRSHTDLDMERAARLFVQPMAIATASSAIGLGMASQAMGLWMSAFAGAMDAMNRASVLDLPALDLKDAPSPDAFRPGATPGAKVRATVESLRAEAAVTARHASKAVAGAARAAEATVALPTPSVAKPGAMPRPRMPDDLKAISGIGPKLEKVLNELGIWTYAQIAGWNASEVDWVDDLLSFNGRIARDKWIEQAAALANRA